MSKAAKEADDYCSWGLLRVARGGYTVGWQEFQRTFSETYL